jgi:hypothetical protein
MIEHIIVSEASIKTNESSAIVQSNVDFVDALKKNFIRQDELSPESLKSYFVSQYSKLMDGGGFAEFVLRTGWGKEMITHLVAGLESLGAEEHLKLLAAFTERLTLHGADGIACLYDSEHPQNQQLREFLNELMPEFSLLNTTENLTELNAKWIKNHPKLVVMSEANMQRQIKATSAAIPDRLSRIAQFLSEEPKHMKLIRLLCDHADLEFIQLETVTQLQDASIAPRKWDFQAVQGPFYVEESPTDAALFDARTKVRLAALQISEVA